MRGLAGKVAVIVGGAGGIGTATSVRLAEEGCTVVVADLDATAAEAVADRIRGNGGRASSCATDIADEAQVRALMDRTVEDHGGIDVVHVNAADLSRDTIGRDTDAVDIPLEVLDRTMTVGARGHVLCARYAIPAMVARGGGALVFTSSGAAFAGEPQRLAYSMAKNAVHGLVRHIATRWGKDGVRANAIAPGLVRTARNFDVLERDGQLGPIIETIKSPRVGTPDDIAAAVAFLASDDGEWITGQVISVDGGMHMR